MTEKETGDRYVGTMTVAGIIVPESRSLDLKYSTVVSNFRARGHSQIAISNVVPNGGGPNAALSRTIAVREARVYGDISLEHAGAQFEKLVLPLRLATPASVRLGHLHLRPGTLEDGFMEGSSQPALDHFGAVALVELSSEDCSLIEASLLQLFYDKKIDEALRRFTLAVNESDRAEACLKFLVAGETLVDPSTTKRDRKSRVSSRLARLTFGSDREGFREAQALFRDVYDYRQFMWHGETDVEKTSAARQWLEQHAEQVRAYVSFVIQRCLLLIRLHRSPLADIMLQSQHGDAATLQTIDSLPLVYFQPKEHIINLDLTKFSLSQGASVEFIDSSPTEEPESDTWHKEH